MATYDVKLTDDISLGEGTVEAGTVIGRITPAKGFTAREVANALINPPRYELVEAGQGQKQKPQQQSGGE